MADAGDGSHFRSSPLPAPARVTLAPFTPCASPAPRRLSARPARAPPVARRQLAWVSLQGRLVGSAKATSAAAIGGGLALEEAAAWELFSPLHRVLIVAVVAVATRESKRSRMISQLQRSVDLRDQVLEGMQQKLEELCEQMNSAKDPSMNKVGRVSCDEMPEWKEAEFCKCGHQLPELNPESGIAPLYRNPSNKLQDFDGIVSGNDDFKTIQQEERRMSDLSDLCSSVTSSVDIQLSSLAAEQDFYNLRKECEEKDAVIKELTAAAHAARVTDSKRIMELEEIIKRKNKVITEMKKDMMVLEQKVIQLTRERRSSSSSNINTIQLPVMADNLLYDMSSTSPSSSDSDSPAKHREYQSQGSVTHNISQEHSSEIVDSQRQPSLASFCSINKSRDWLPKQKSLCPNYDIRKANPIVALRPKRLVSSGGEFKKTKRHIQQESKGTVSQGRWV